jgi:WD40 repeat protein
VHMQVVLTFEAPFMPTCMCHPPTYLNKILLGSSDGSLQIWNLSTAKCLYTFSGWGSAVTCVEPSPALDVAAAGLANGAVVLFNMRYDEEVMTLHNAGAAQADQGESSKPAATGASAACTSISFRYNFEAGIRQYVALICLSSLTCVQRSCGQFLVCLSFVSGAVLASVVCMLGSVRH